MSQDPKPEVPDINKRVDQYIRLRDLIATMTKEFEEKMKPYAETLEQLNGVLLEYLNTINADNVKTEAGTVYKNTMSSASISDPNAFWTFVVTQANWELLDKRANKSAVEDHIKKHGVAPPGVNFSVRHLVGVRRRSK